MFNLHIVRNTPWIIGSFGLSLGREELEKYEGKDGFTMRGASDGNTASVDDNI